jgi:hypothetical protein
MGDAAAEASWRAKAGWLVAIAAVVVASAWVRWPGFTQGGFANHDVAGILYNAMLLHAGELPYVANLEMKEPGSFYLAAALAGADGTDIARFQIAANLWALGSLVATAHLAWMLWGPRSALMAAAVLALHDAFLDTMDANYVTWALLPMILAMSWSLAGARHEPGRSRWLCFAVAGLCAGAAVLLKRQAGVAIPLVLLVAVWPRSLWLHASDPRVRDRITAAAATLAGVLAIHVPLVAHYATHAELRALWDGYVINRWALDYASFGTQTMGPEALREGLLALAYFLALPLALAVFAALPPRNLRRQTRGPAPISRISLWVLLWIWAGAALLAASIGFRFYKGYFLAVAPPLCLLAAAPWGALGSAYRLPRWVHALVFVPILALVARQVHLLHAERVNRARAHDLGGRTIARHLLADTPAGARIWVWGWHLWDVYPFTNMLSASRIYKSDGLLTTGNDATWRRPRSPLQFVDGPPAQLLLEDFKQNPPYYIVLGSTVPAHQFKALQTHLRTHYTRDPRTKLGRVQFWKKRE